jgi:hypothetical protein
MIVGYSLFVDSSASFVAGSYCYNLFDVAQSYLDFQNYYKKFLIDYKGFVFGNYLLY